MDQFAAILQYAVFANVFGGPILGNDHRPTLTPLPVGGQLIPTAIPGHQETITLWGFENGSYQQLTAQQAAEHVLTLQAMGLYPMDPEQAWAREIEILDMLPTEPVPQVAELVAVHHITPHFGFMEP